MKLNLKGKKVLVYGLGISGQSACKLLHEKGACVSIYDDEKRFANVFNYEKEPITKNYDLVVVSPGIKVIGNHIISHFVSNGTNIISELDLGFLFCKGKVIAITGTNGKTTVTALTGEIFKMAGHKTFVCGNIGLPICSVSSKTDKNSFVVCEVSNFQLELSKYFSANECAILNLAPDHLDRHGSYQEYLRIKKKILSKKKSQKVVLNFDDKEVNCLKNDKKTLYFSKNPLNKGVFVKNNYIFHNKTKIISLNDIPLFGEKNLENVLASIALAVRYKIKATVIKQAIMNFKAPPHRLEYLGKAGEADVFDDSKATNVSACVSAINSLGENGLVLLIGGLNKGFSFDEIFNKKYNFENILCFGDAAPEIFDCAKKYGYQPKIFNSMKNAAFYARDNACQGQKILLAPACSSFDEFSSYAERGEIFKEIMLGTFEKIEMQ